MEHYLVNWFHAYVTHFGMWMSLLSGFAIYKDGLPKVKKMLSMFKSILVMSAVMSMFSSHSQTHMVEHFLAKEGVSAKELAK